MRHTDPMRVYPYKNKTDTESTLDSISSILEDVEREIKRVDESADFEVRKIISSVDRLIQQPKAANNNAYQGYGRQDDEEEEVKLSHEIARDTLNRDISAELSKVKMELLEYKRRYAQSIEKLKDNDIKYNEVESKLETVSDENSKLKNELGKRRAPANANASKDSVSFLL